MKISRLIKTLNRAKKQHGDILIGIDVSSFSNETLSDDRFVILPEVFGVFKLAYEDLGKKKTVVLCGFGDSLLVDEKDLLK